MTAIPLDRGQLREALADATLAAASLAVQAGDRARTLDLEDFAAKLLAGARVALTARQTPADATLIAAIDEWLETDDPPAAPAAAPAQAAPRPEITLPPPTHRWQLTHDGMEMRLLDERRVVVGRVQQWVNARRPGEATVWAPSVVEGGKVRQLKVAATFDEACALVEGRLGVRADRWTVAQTAKSPEAA